MDPEQQYILFLTDALNSIEAIDKATPFTETEPQWWLDMADTRRILVHKLSDLIK